MYERAEKLIKENEEEILCLAHALETHKTLSGEDVIAVLETRSGSIVDGRPYAEKSFIKEIRKYHESCLIAHREHRTPEIALPRS